MPADPNEIRIPDSPRVFDRRKVLFVLLLFLAMLMLAVSSVNVALPTIEDGLDASGSDLQWVLSGYALAFGISLVPAGRAGDALGRGAVFLIGVVLFIGASLACGLAPQPGVLNLARLAQGLAAGIVSPQITGMIQQYFDGRARAMAFAFFGLVISASVAVGPLIAGVIIAAVGPEDGWRWAFLINIPVGLLSLALALRWFPFTRERELWQGRRGPLPRIDLDPVGSILLTVGVLCLMLPFMVHDQPLIWLVLIGAPVMLWLWVRWERRYQAGGREPMVDLGLFRFTSFTSQMRISAMVFLVQPPAYVLLALFSQNGLGKTALEVGVVGLSGAATSGISSILSGKHALTRGRQLITLALISMAASSLGTILVAYLIDRYDISFWWLALSLSFNGLGMGVIGSVNQTLAMQDVPVRFGGTAGGVKQTTERVATAVGTAIITGVFFAVQPRWGWTAAYAFGHLLIHSALLFAVLFAIVEGRRYRGLDERPSPTS